SCGSVRWGSCGPRDCLRFDAVGSPRRFARTVAKDSLQWPNAASRRHRTSRAAGPRVGTLGCRGGRGPREGSPAVVRERLVRIRHAMGFLALLDRAAAILGSVNKLGRELARHRVLTTL